MGTANSVVIPMSHTEPSSAGLIPALAGNKRDGGLLIKLGERRLTPSRQMPESNQTSITNASNVAEKHTTANTPDANLRRLRRAVLLVSGAWVERVTGFGGVAAGEDVSIRKSR